MLDISWKPCPPPESGDYLTKRILSFSEDQHKLRTIKAVILPAHFDGEKWNLVVDPDYYRALPVLPGK